jgi:hypothetical protein
MLCGAAAMAVLPRMPFGAVYREYRRLVERRLGGEHQLEVNMSDSERQSSLLGRREFALRLLGLSPFGPFWRQLGIYAQALAFQTAPLAEALERNRR